MHPAITKCRQDQVHSLYEQGLTPERIARATGVKQKTVNKLLMRYRTWKAGLCDSQYTGVVSRQSREPDPTEEEIAEAARNIKEQNILKMRMGL